MDIQMFDMDDSDFKDNLFDALGIRSGDTVNIVTPQFERDDGVDVLYFPTTAKEFDSLKLLSKDDLLKTGCRIWDEVPVGSDDEDGLDEGFRYWLFTKEWYQFIPNGYNVTGLFGEEYPFESGESDDDIRFGVLPYGFKQCIK